MTQKTQLRNDFEIFLKQTTKENSLNDIGIVNLKANELINETEKNIYIKSTLFILVLNGSTTVEINYKEYKVNEGEIIALSLGHIFKIKKLSLNFEGLSFYIGKEYASEMYSVDMLYKKVKYTVKLYNNPILDFDEKEFYLLQNRIHFITSITELKNHHYLKEMILNSIRIFFLDLSNIIEHKTIGSNQKTSREEIYFQQFLDLLIQHYKQEHLVDFYAQKINITSHYLTLIVKKLSGQTVSQFIFQLIFSEAQLLLKQPELSIQEISDQLNFSDQSAFGKFFKRKSNESPKTYRNQSLKA